MVGVQNTRAHGIDSVSISPFSGSAPHSRAVFRILQKVVDHFNRCTLIARINEERGTLPQFTEGWNVRQDQGTFHLSSFQHRKTEGFITSHRDEDRPCAQMLRNLCVAYPTKHFGMSSLNMRTVWPFKRPGGENRYREVRRDSINDCEILAFVPEAPSREDDMFIGHASAHRHRTSAITDDSR